MDEKKITDSTYSTITRITYDGRGSHVAQLPCLSQSLHTAPNHSNAPVEEIHKFNGPSAAGRTRIAVSLNSP